MLSSRGTSRPRDQTRISYMPPALAGGLLTTEPPGKPVVSTQILDIWPPRAMGLGQHNFQGIGLPCSYLGLTSTLFPMVSLLVFFFFLSPHNISLQMSHFRELFVFRKTHSSVLMKLEVKM